MKPVNLNRRRKIRKSIFRKTAVIFVIVALAPVTVLGLRAHHFYTDELNRMVDDGIITRDVADYQVHELVEQAVVYTGYGLVVALVLGYFFASSLVRPIRELEQGARRIGDGDLGYRVETDTDDELEELAGTINQMAASLESRESEIDQRQRDISILYDVAHTMSESRELNDLLGYALDQAMQVTGSQSGCVLLQDEAGSLFPVAIKESPAVTASGAAPSPNHFNHAAGAATTEGRPVVFDYPAEAKVAGGCSIACIPLKFEGNLQGAICVSGTRQGFPARTLELLSAIGSELAVAIENARLFDKMEKQNEELGQATAQIARLFAEAERNRSFGTRYRNPNLVRCWELKECVHLDCPAFGLAGNLRCWQVAGTHCGGEVQGLFAQKLGRCEKCEVFKMACPDRITQLGETFNNMMAVLEQRVREQEELQEQLFSSSKLAAIGELAAGVAHEINNPLTGILGNAMLMKTRPYDADAALKRVSVIESEALRAREIVRTLLDFAHQGQTLERQPVQVDQLLDHTLSLLRHQADISAVQIETDIEENLPELAVDGNQIKQVFMNIIHNAIHAMEPGGRLDIRARLTRCEKGGTLRDTMEISFTDTGTGMEEELITRIFDPFYTTKGVGEGTGLGLSVSQRIVGEHGGEIRVVSLPGSGSTFTVALPVTTVDEPTAADREVA